MKWFALAVAFSMLGLVGSATAADNPTGTWKWSNTFNNQTRESTLKLKLDGDKLTGAMVGRDNKETAIEDGKFADGEISFSISRERNGNKIVQKFSGKLSGDTIKGKIESERDGKTNSRDWEAKKSAE
ncbi:MAG TPA: hypothetical protein VFE24_06270 [Pirellulales bacterium]|jgi:hypothetical protein|nr:hypothetical protein [Pirellulales bacterium]